MRTRTSRSLKIAMGIGYAFLYLPIVTLIIFSFNASRQITVWKGFSTQWYSSLFEDTTLIRSALVSFQIAVCAATLATVLGTLAAIALVRGGRFRGKNVFGILATAPLVMPEVITGLSLLLLFVGLEQLVGWPKGRGILTITIAHTTLCMAYVTILVRGRLAEMDRSLEEAALDLGARPLRVFTSITLPIISPVLLSGWLLAFALSLDDIVLASFVAGPSASTLPMVIFSSIRFNLSPQINALATLIITSVGISVGIAGWLLHRKKD